MFEADPILPPDDDESGLEPLHDREYRVRAYRRPNGNLVVRGAVRDQKPPNLYFPDDHEPMTIHHMQVDHEIEFPKLVIADVQVRFETHPHTACPRIIDNYDGLIGLSITRGFTHRVRELFGGPRGCSHTTALLQAMGPVAVQSMWSMTMLAARAEGRHGFVARRDEDFDQRMMRVTSNINTCHVWQEDGELIEAVRTGVAELPLFVRRRMDTLGISQG